MPQSVGVMEHGSQKRWTFGLRDKLFLMLFVVNFAVSAGFAGILYRTLKDGIIEDTDGRLLSVAYGVREMIPPAYFDRVGGKEPIPDAEYVVLVKRLTDYVRAADLSYIYALIRDDDGRILEAVTSVDPGEIENGTYEVPRTPYPSAPEALYRTFADRRTRSDTYKDAYGDFRSIFLPAKAPSGRTYVIGVDKSLAAFSERLHHALRLTAMVGGLVFVLSCVAGALAINHLTRPLKDLTHFARQTQASHFALHNEDLSGIARLGGGHDEIGDLSLAMREMLSALNRYVVELQTANAARARMEAEFSAAHDIQQGMVPHTPPVLPKWARVSLAAAVEPAKAVGGDLYDYFLVGDDLLFFIVGDVSGKGLPAALFMAITCTLFRTLAMQGGTRLDAVMTQANRYLVENNPSGMFVTVFAGVLDLRSGRVVYADGGHEPPVLLRADGRAEDLVKTGGMALGVMDVPYATGTFDLAPGEGFVLFTDGVTEAMNPDRDLFTRERALHTLAGQAASDAPALLRRMLDAVHVHAEGAAQYDDITVLAVRYDGVAAGSHPGGDGATTEA